MRNFTKIIGLSLTLFFGVQAVKAQQSVGVGTNTPDASARLDINASDKGLLIPKVFLVSLSDAVTIATPANGLMLYNTNKTLPGGTGFYYNSGTSGAPVWSRFQTGASSGSGWGLTGNAATDSLVNFIGTTDVKPLVFRLNNLYAGQLGANGGIALGRGANETSRYTPGSLIAIGDSALFNNLDSNVIAIGEAALYSNTTGSNNTAVGNISLLSNETANDNTAIGFAALASTQARRNTGVGSRVLANNTIGESNSALGYGALNSNDNGFFNTAIGSLALVNNTIADYNTGVGTFSLYENTTGVSNTAVGFDAVGYSVSGNSNTGVGSSVLYNLTTGSFNTAIGDSATVASGALNNTIAIGKNAVATASNTVRIGNTGVTSIGGQVNWSVLSDGRYKKDISEDISGLNFIMQLRPVSYHYNFDKIRSEQAANSSKASINSNIGVKGSNISSGKFNNKLLGDRNIAVDASRTANNNKGNFKTPFTATVQLYNEEVKQNDQMRYTGFIAQEVEAAAKRAGFDFSGVDKPKNDNDQYALRYAEFVVPLVKAVQEQQAIIDAQNKKIDDLIKRLEKLEQK